MFSSSLQTVIKALQLAQFLRLLDELQIDRGGLFARASPDESLAYLESQAAAVAMQELAITQALTRVIGVQSFDEVLSKLVSDRIADATTQLDNTAASATPQPLASKTIERIACIRSAKKVHDIIQHELAFKLTGFSKAAEDLESKKPRSRSAALRVVNYMTADVENATASGKFLRPAKRKLLEEANAIVLKKLRRLTAALNPDTPEDPSTGEEMLSVLNDTLRPYLAQIPSKMHETIVEESSEIPWSSLGTFVTPVAGSDSSQPFNALQLLFDQLIQEHGSWQFITVKLTLVEERMNSLFPIAEATRTTQLSPVKFVMRDIRELAETGPLSTECIPLVRKLSEALTLEKPTTDPSAGPVPVLLPLENDVFVRLEALLVFVNDSFDKSDKQLLSACDQLESISKSLQKFS